MCIILIILTIVDFIIPDPLPFIDEAILALLSIGVCGLKSKG